MVVCQFLGVPGGRGRVRHTCSMIGPHGEKRPGDTVANALHVAKIATGEAEETSTDTKKRKGGKKGGEARAAALSPDERSQIAQVAAAARCNQE